MTSKIEEFIKASPPSQAVHLAYAVQADLAALRGQCEGHTHYVEELGSETSESTIVQPQEEPKAPVVKGTTETVYYKPDVTASLPVLKQELANILLSRTMGSYASDGEGNFVPVNWLDSPVLYQYVDKIIQATAHYFRERVEAELTAATFKLDRNSQIIVEAALDRAFNVEEVEHE